MIKVSNLNLNLIYEVSLWTILIVTNTSLHTSTYFSKNDFILKGNYKVRYLNLLLPKH